MGSLPSELGELRNLEKLYLPLQRSVTGEIPSELGQQLNKLERLELSDNLLTGEIRRFLS